MENDNIIKIIDENDIVHEYNVVMQCHIKSFNRDYTLYEDNNKIYGLAFNHSDGSLVNAISDEEWDILNDLLDRKVSDVKDE